MVHKHLIIPFIALLFLSSCNVQEVNFKGVENIQLVKMENNVMEFNVSARLGNPNTFNINMIDSDMDFYLENTYMCKAFLQDPITILKKKEEVYTFMLKTGKIDQKKLLPILLKAALTGKVKVGVKGDVKGKVYFISKKVNIDMEDDVDINQDLFKN
ncbi:MAG: LEA14-like dessication related protein [Patiriisocius sp.]|jgi:LEA14-like dessication related protein